MKLRDMDCKGAKPKENAWKFNLAPSYFTESTIFTKIIDVDYLCK